MIELAEGEMTYQHWDHQNQWTFDEAAMHFLYLAWKSLTALILSYHWIFLELLKVIKE